MAEPWEYWPTAQKRQREQKAPGIIQELIKNTNLDTNTINDVVKGYVQGGDLKFPSILSQDTQGPLNQNQMRETATNSLRPPIYVQQEGTDTFSPAPAGVHDRSQIVETKPPHEGIATYYTTGPDGYQIVKQEKATKDAWINVTHKFPNGGRPDPYAGKDPVRVKDALATLAEHRKRLAPHYGPGGQVTPPQIDPELENRAIDAAQYIGVPVHTETTPGNPGHSFMGIRWGDTPESKRIVIGDTPMDPSAPVQPRKQESARSFNSVEDAEAAHLPKGTIIMIGGRRARVK